MYELQYLKHVRAFRETPIFERFPVLICIGIVWIYSVILTASGAYRHKSPKTQQHCRTDRANLISTAPWYIKIPTFQFFLYFHNLFFVLNWGLRFLFMLIGSCSHTLSSGAHLPFLQVMHLLPCLQLLSQWLRYFFSFFLFFIVFTWYMNFKT